MRFSRGLVCSLVTWCIALPALSDDLDAPVTGQYKAASAKAIVESLGKQANVNLTTSAALSSEPLIVSVDKAPLKDVMAKIATALFAEWQKEPTGYRLVRTPQTSRAMAQADIDYFSNAIKSRLAQLAKEASEFGAYTAEKARAQAEIEQRNRAAFDEMMRQGGGNVTGQRITPPVTPISYTLKQILGSWNPNELASLPIRSRTVYAMTPNANQRPMPGAASNLLRNYAAIHSLYLQALNDLPKPSTDRGMIMLDGMATKPMKGQLSEAHLIFARERWDSVTATLRVYDSEGVVAAENTTVLNFTADPNAPPTGSTGADEEKIALSDLAKRHGALIQYTPARSPGDIMVVGGLARGGGRRTIASVEMSAPGGSGPAPLPKPELTREWRDLLGDPNKNEPLSFAASEFAVGTASGLRKNLVASLGDDTIVPLGARFESSMRPSEFLLALKTLHHRVTVENGWIVIRPEMPTVASNSRVSRTAAASLLKSIVSSGRLTLDAAAQFVQGLQGPYQGGFLDRYVGLFDRDSRLHFINLAQTQFDMCKLYGSLDAMKRQQLAGGARLNIAAMSIQQREIVAHMLFHSPDGPEFEVPNQGGPNEVNRSVARISGEPNMVFTGMIDRLAFERTEYLAPGLPSAGVLTLELESEPAVYATSSTADEGRFFTAQEYGLYRGLMANNGVLPRAEFPLYDKFRLAKRTILAFHFQIDANVSLDRMLRDASVDQNSGTMAYEQLPEDFRKAVESMNVRFGPPPPPGAKAI